mmetsp:Transcript_5261/g.15721  ORF Transcript_5261/g.15721 Transcript_5261/m.15721 type:complete len:92 (-) Transcript_5261:1138-1413(-)
MKTGSSQVLPGVSALREHSVFSLSNMAKRGSKRGATANWMHKSAAPTTNGFSLLPPIFTGICTRVVTTDIRSTAAKRCKNRLMPHFDGHSK